MNRGAQREPLYYLKTFLKDGEVATVSPSSRFVVRKVVKKLDVLRADCVVEYGPADGVITRGLLRAMPSAASLIAIERNPNFYKALSSLGDPRLRAVHGDVRLVERHVRALGFSAVDRVVSGVPFSFLKPEERDALLAATARLLKPGGRFVAYQCTTHLIPLLRRHFRKVDVGFEVLNLPPLFVFTCVK